MTLGSTAGLSFTTGDGTADASMVIQGTVAAINAALDGLSFAPNTNFNGTATITLQTEDLGNTGSGGNLTDTDVLSIQVGGLRFQEGVNGYIGTQDTYVTSNPGNSSFGSATTVMVDDPSSHGLIRFDNLFGNGAGQIAVGSTITNATLSIYVTATDNLDAINVHRMLSTWSEASTWNTMSSGVQTNNVEASTIILTSFSAGQAGWVTSPASHRQCKLGPTARRITVLSCSVTTLTTGSSIPPNSRPCRFAPTCRSLSIASVR